LLIRHIIGADDAKALAEALEQIDEEDVDGDVAEVAGFCKAGPFMIEPNG